MATVNQRLHCRLCGEIIDSMTSRMHLRWVHQVVPGERTLADIPVGGRADWPKPLEAGEELHADQHLVAV